MSEINSDPHHKTNIGFGNDDNKIPTNAFLKCSQSSAAEKSDWGTVTVGVVCAYAIYGGREKGRKAFLKYSQSLAAEESDWGTVTVSIICAYAVCGGRERGRKVVTLTALFQNFQFGDMAFQVYTH